MTVGLTCGEQRVSLPGLVDSGADGTLLPLDILPLLGIGEDQVKKGEGRSQGAGNTAFNTWTTTAEITGQVLWLNDGAIEPWGPLITLQPAFARDTAALFGRSDFFTPFAITFVTLPGLGSVFHLDYDEAGASRN